MSYIKSIFLFSFFTLIIACKMSRFNQDSQLYHSGAISQAEFSKKYYIFFNVKNDTLKLKNLINGIYVAQKNIYFNGKNSLKYRGIKFFLSDNKLVYVETSYVDSKQEVFYLLKQEKNFSGYVDATSPSDIIKTEFIINDYGSLGRIIREYDARNDSLIKINQYNIKSPYNEDKEKIVYIKMPM